MFSECFREMSSFISQKTNVTLYFLGKFTKIYFNLQNFRRKHKWVKLNTRTLSECILHPVCSHSWVWTCCHRPTRYICMKLHFRVYQKSDCDLLGWYRAFLWTVTDVPEEQTASIFRDCVNTGGVSRFFQNLGISLQDYTKSHARKSQSGQLPPRRHLHYI
jgi:hypothetical protein